MPFIGGGHIWLLLILLVVVLIIWGPGKLPEIGSGMGRAIREFRRASSEAQDSVKAVEPRKEQSSHEDGSDSHAVHMSQ
ncbi:MAG: twin-arginine translocase TatA/TatE family subunit [Chloroflexi bacterium]|nr:MAG: twin-arginine translocase TatA/TatE family subunit [Chloroflexota bacterium]TMF14723.1 MAG: twin-arginine translocase TatA/TatE family subunit [Chloroflexota bacterium]